VGDVVCLAMGALLSRCRCGCVCVPMPKCRWPGVPSRAVHSSDVVPVASSSSSLNVAALAIRISGTAAFVLVAAHGSHSACTLHYIRSLFSLMACALCVLQVAAFALVAYMRARKAQEAGPDVEAPTKQMVATYYSGGI
jgi:hypothetical protein